MAVKYFDIDGIGKIRVQKRRGSRTMRIRVAQDSSVTVGIPYWVPYKAALIYAREHSNWILKHRSEQTHFENNQKIGKTHTIQFIEKDVLKPKTKTTEQFIHVFIPLGSSHKEAEAQLIAKKAAKNVLKTQAHLLEKILSSLSDELGYSYKSSSYKFMKSKWGSCNSQKHITLNYRLLDLPEHLINYVVVHELVHLNHMNHSKGFWDELEGIMPDYKMKKAELRSIKLSW